MIQIYDLLQNDHDKVKILLDELVSLEESQRDQRHFLVDGIREELIPHSRAEEAVFYNTLRSLDAAKDLANHGYKEHLEIEALLRMLQVRDKIDIEWRQTAIKLQRLVIHHTYHEESQFFSAAKQLFTPDEAVMMGEAFEQLKQEVQLETDISTTVELVANLMPGRFVTVFRDYNLVNRL